MSPNLQHSRPVAPTASSFESGEKAMTFALSPPMALACLAALWPWRQEQAEGWCTSRGCWTASQTHSVRAAQRRPRVRSESRPPVPPCRTASLSPGTRLPPLAPPSRGTHHGNEPPPSHTGIVRSRRRGVTLRANVAPVRPREGYLYGATRPSPLGGVACQDTE